MVGGEVGRGSSDLMIYSPRQFDPRRPKGHESIAKVLFFYCRVPTPRRVPECRIAKERFLRGLEGSDSSAPSGRFALKHNTQGKPWAMLSSPFGARIALGSSKILSSTPSWKQLVYGLSYLKDEHPLVDADLRP